MPTMARDQKTGPASLSALCQPAGRVEGRGYHQWMSGKNWRKLWYLDVFGNLAESMLIYYRVYVYIYIYTHNQVDIE